MSVTLSETKSPTVLGDYQRTVRDEPLHYIYKFRFFLERDSVPAEEVVAWLRERYTTRPRGHRYRVTFYRAQDGQRYVDAILMETCNDTDLVYIRLKWGYSEVRVKRGNRLVQKRLKPDQRAKLKAILKQASDEFYSTL